MQEVSDGRLVAVTDSQKGIFAAKNPGGSGGAGRLSPCLRSGSVALSVYRSDYKMIKLMTKAASANDLGRNFPFNV